ncbi:MAG: DUF86 domain-containing protein [Candidatus Methanoplasma sp.]|nr:DUF86 domain-containing protein [Candidatus Methanoplasma sp.]
MTEGSYSKHDRENIRIILKHCEEIEYFIRLYGSDEEEFEGNPSLQCGCVVHLMQIGEHVKRLSPEIRNDREEIDWKDAAGLRDIIAHQYEDLNYSWIRKTVLNRIPVLKDVCQSILDDDKTSVSTNGPSDSD